MYFIEQRVQVICNQLGNFRFRDRQELPDWEYKHGQFFRPEEAEASAAPWEKVDCRHMHWYATRDGSNEFEG